MKIILGKTGSGKSRYIMKKASEYVKESRGIHILSGEMCEVDFKSAMYDLLEGDIAKVNVKFSSVPSFSDAASIIMGDKQSDIFFVDTGFPITAPNMSNSDAQSSALALLDAVEDLTGKKIYITQQAHANSSEFEDKELKVFDYVKSLEF